MPNLNGIINPLIVDDVVTNAQPGNTLTQSLPFNGPNADVMMLHVNNVTVLNVVYMDGWTNVICNTYD